MANQAKSEHEEEETKCVLKMSVRIDFFDRDKSCCILPFQNRCMRYLIIKYDQLLVSFVSF